MCGIAGIFAYADAAPLVDDTELLRMREAMAKRGPDGAGSWISADRRIGLGNRRLAILDLSDAGAQPMASADGALRITFNGEIYNYRQLRKELERRGYAFRSDSDTEVLLHLYADRGKDMVQELRGMYGFAIWDEREKTLFLARDPFGIKPVYYADDGSTLRFASQVKALLAGGGVDTAPEPAGSAGFLLWGSVPEPYTLYRGIHAVPAGAALTITRRATPQVRSHFSVREELLSAESDATPFKPEDRESLAEALRDTVRHHLVSDVPVGIFLSAGIDSSLITALAAEHQAASLRTLTLGFHEHRGTGHDEVPIAEQTAALRGTLHETRWIRGEEFQGEMQSILDAMDQPTIDGVNSYFVCREAARAGLKVALSGLGGDELFGGYPSFRDVPRLSRWLKPLGHVPLVGRAARRAVAPFVSAFTSPKYAGLLEYGGKPEGAYLLRRALYMPWEIGEVLDPVRLHTGLERLQTALRLDESIRGLRRPHAQVVALELSWYLRNQLLRDADWAGMAHSLEVRVPFVDVPLFRHMARWLVSATPPLKPDAAAAARLPLQADILLRPKSGFSVPVQDWLAKKPASHKQARGLRQWALQVLPRQRKQFRALALVSDAFGCQGGIAKFNRDLLSVLAAMPECAEVVAIPRRAAQDPGDIPARIRFRADAAGAKGRFVRVAAKEALSGPFDLVIAGHINLAPLAAMISRAKRSRCLLVLHGIDAWRQHRSALVRSSLRHMDTIVGVSRLTLDRFSSWAKVQPGRLRVLPNCVDSRQFAPGPKSEALAARLGLAGRTVIMTLGRLASEEQYKGFDEVIDALPLLAREVPDIAYLICGEGADRSRLEARAAQRGVAERVVFTGFVPEEAKADYFRLADAYVMPGRGEGFGIAYLEAMACGTPVVASKLDASREAVMDGRLGILVDPDDQDEVLRGIREALSRTRSVPKGIEYFSRENFQQRLVGLLMSTLAAPQEAK